MQISVERGIPIPPVFHPGGPGRPSIYPWRKMKKSLDSFFVPGKTPRQFGGSGVALKRYGFKIATRSTIERVKGKKVKGVRVWRV